MKIPGGFFITLEGIEGCGKSTQSRHLVEYLRGACYAVTHTREPGGTAIGRRIRSVLLDPESAGITPLSELLLYSADRAQHLTEVVEPALKAGGVVVCDRFSDATIAYQGHGRGLDIELISSLNGIATRGLKPGLTLVLDLPVEVGLVRAIGRNDKDGNYDEARFELEALEFHEKVRQGYLEIAEKEPARVKIVDASRTEDEIHEEIRSIVERELANQ